METMMPLASSVYNCYVCKKLESVPNQFIRCPTCHVQVYCSEECRLIDWNKDHKTVCMSIAKRLTLSLPMSTPETLSTNLEDSIALRSAMPEAMSPYKKQVAPEVLSSFQRKQVKLRNWVLKYTDDIVAKLRKQKTVPKHILVYTNAMNATYSIGIMKGDGRSYYGTLGNVNQYDELVKNDRTIFIYFMCSKDKTNDSIVITI